MAKRLRETAQILVNEFGTVGPSDAEEMAKHAVQEINRSTEREHLLEIERDEARAEVERLYKANSKYICGWVRTGIEPNDVPHHESYRRGAEAMREACARVADAHCVPGTRDVIRSLPIPEEP
jgi:hypothetical protein